MHNKLKSMIRFQKSPMNVQLEEKEQKGGSQEPQRINTRRLGKSGQVAAS